MATQWGCAPAAQHCLRGPQVQQHNGHVFASYQVSIPQSCEQCLSYIWLMDKALLCSGECPRPPPPPASPTMPHDSTTTPPTPNHVPDPSLCTRAFTPASGQIFLEHCPAPSHPLRPPLSPWGRAQFFAGPERHPLQPPHHTPIQAGQRSHLQVFAHTAPAAWVDSESSYPHRGL